MPTIQIITHKHDHFVLVHTETGELGSGYLLFDVMVEIGKRGYRPIVTAGTPEKTHDADIAFLHVDTTIVPPEYIDYAKTFPIRINAGVIDITKRCVSQAVLGPDEDWGGPVMVKSDMNCAGIRETLIDKEAVENGEQPTYGFALPESGYQVFDAVDAVPAALRDRPDLVIEKFLPEREADGYGTRFWVFLGDGERCYRFVSPDPVVKGRSAIRCEPVPVPDELRELRHELKFDFGKFDFVMHDGRAVLIDANKTVSRPKKFADIVMGAIPEFADGLERLIKKQMADNAA